MLPTGKPLLLFDPSLRLLKADIAEATRVLSPPLLAVTNFSEALSPEMKEQVFREFNSFSVIFQVRRQKLLLSKTRKQMLNI